MSGRHTSTVSPLFFFLLFLVAVLSFTKDVGQSEMLQRAADQTIVATPERAPSDMVVSVDPVAPHVVVTQQHVSSAHVQLPSVVRGVYLTGWSAGNERTISRILQMIDDTELNAVIVDIKDATGRLSYQPKDQSLIDLGVGTNRIKDLPSLIEMSHRRGVYVIGRVAVFQDPFFADRYPNEAFIDTRTGELWRDYKGITWLRPDSVLVWDHLVAIAKDAYAQGFDEINVDYVRFPSDGPLTYLGGMDRSISRVDAIKSFFAYIDPLLRGEGMVLSADLFGLTMSAQDDLGIGQKLESIAPHVDVIAPMVYPSHFAPGAYGIARPAEVPGDVIRIALSHGIKKLENAGLDPAKLRPWLQDFNLGALYTTDMVRAQIEASEALGLVSWMLWDPRNIYTKEALLPAFSETALQ